MNEEKMARHLFRIDLLFRSNQATAISFDKYISLKQKVWNENDRNTAPLSRRSDYQPNGAGIAMIVHIK